MARALRIDRAGGWHHVTARGNERRPIWRDDMDRKAFLDRVADGVVRFRLRVHGYVLMPNHYHLLLELPEGGLSRAMQWLNLSYSAYFNARHQRTGHLFQGRFSNVVVEDGAWVLALSVYLHLNPIRVRALGLGKRERAMERRGALRAPTAEQVARRLAALRRWRWSSYRAYAGYERVPAWLTTQTISSRLPEPYAGGRVGYRKYVEDRVRQDEDERPWDHLWAQMALGSEAFVDELRGVARGKLHREHVLRSQITARATFEEVVAAAERATGRRWNDVRDRRGDPTRDLVLWAARRWGGYRHAELGRRVDLDYGAVTMALRRFDERIKDDRLLRQQAVKLGEMLDVTI